jgi:hypothetical protein
MTLSACKATERANSFVIPASPKRCPQCTQSLAAQGWPHWRVASLARYLKVGVRFPMSCYTLIAEVVAVLAYPKGSHLANGVARQAYLPIARRLLLAFSRGARELIGRAGTEDLTDGKAGF